jgi:hypothetical protein
MEIGSILYDPGEGETAFMSIKVRRGRPDGKKWGNFIEMTKPVSEEAFDIALQKLLVKMAELLGTRVLPSGSEPEKLGAED